MRCTLSQSDRPTTDRPRGVETRVDRSLQSIFLATLATLATLSMTGIMTGCGDSNASGSNGSSHSNQAAQTSSDHGESAARFVWPEDPDHPLLTLEIESDPGSGTITIELMPELAPATVARVMELAREQYYDGTTFHRVIPGFMIQGGDPNSRDRDPNNDGHGNPELRIADEFGEAPFLRGVVGMGNKGGRNSTGGQFFIMHADGRNLDGRYTAIGRVASGMDVVDAIMRVSIDRIGRWGPKDRPIENVVMKTVELEVRETSSKANRAGGENPQAGESLQNSSANALADL